jgi:putative membrane protein
VITFKLNSVLSSVLVLFLSVGLVGFFTPFDEIFKSLSVYNLLLTLILVFISFKNNLSAFIIPFLLIFILGFISEVAGVNTGLIFGNYKYSQNLGFSVLNVPLIIGVNWAILGMGAWHLSKSLISNKISQIIFGATLMVFFDFIMEPVAISLDFWTWKSSEIPIYNYVSWFFISLITMYICGVFQKEKHGIVKLVFVAQLIFFFILNIKFSWF